MPDRRRITGRELGFHRFRIGEHEAAVVTDGPLLLTPPGDVLHTLAPEQIADALHAAFLPSGPMRIEQNVMLVNIDGALVLFDNGMGSSQLFGPHAGRLPESLADAGVAADEIDALVLSHAHPDHCWGTMRDDGTPAFPGATIYMAEAELRFWEGCTDPAMIEVVKGVAKHLAPLRDRIRFFTDGQEFLPGVQAIGAPGHTVGHTIFTVSSAGKSFVFMGDLSHHPVLLLEKPRMEFSYDSDPKQAAATRVKLLDMIAANKTPVMSYHYAWPGFGNIAKTGDGFHYYPTAMKMEL